jgi:hypothetical protein
VRDVGEERAERHEQLDVEVSSEVDDQLAEGQPAQARLDPQEEHGVAIRPRNPGVVEGVLRPLDPPRQPLVERDVRPVRLEVEKPLGIDVGEALRLPDPREVAARERRPRAAVVPAAEGGDQHRPVELRLPHHPQLAHPSQSRALQACARGR